MEPIFGMMRVDGFHCHLVKSGFRVDFAALTAFLRVRVPLLVPEKWVPPIHGEN